MRIKLKKGIQRKLIILSKKKNNLTWKQLASKLSMSERYLRIDLLNENRLLAENIYHLLCELAGFNCDAQILEKLEDNWGRAKGGKNSVKKEILLTTIESKELAELIGIILGDGNIWADNHYYYLTIVGNEKKDKDYLLNYVKPLIKKVFNEDMNIRRHKTHNELFLYKGSKSLVFTLKHFGLKEGNKIKNNVGIPSWIFKNKSYIRACIRGLIDTDGCVCPITGRNYSYIWFSSNILKLRTDFDKAMKILGIKTSSWNIRKNRTPEIYIGNKNMLFNYMKTISFKNKRNLNKFKAPVV